MEDVVELTKGSDKFKLLMKLIGRINSNLEIDTLLLDIMKAVKKVVNSDASSLMLIDETTGELVMSIPTGPATAEVSGKRFPADQGIAGWVFQNNKSQIVNNVKEDSRFLGDFEKEKFMTRNIICVPLVNNEQEVIGVLQALNKKNGQDFDNNDLVILQTLANQAAIAIETAELHKERLKRKQLEQRLNMAKNIQSSFWPKMTPNISGYDISGTSRPAKWVGGDYYDYIPIGETDKWGIVVADVVGKGLPASLLMATIRAALRTQIENNHSTKETIELVNNSIYQDTPADKFITLFYGELDPVKDTFTYVNAGHNNPYLIDPELKNVTPLTCGGVMLGIQEDATYEFEEIDIEPGQEIVIFSDGIVEAQNEEGDMYGDERLESWLLKHPREDSSDLITLLLREIESFRGSAKQSDDITLLVLKHKPDTNES